MNNNKHFMQKYLIHIKKNMQLDHLNVKLEFFFNDLTSIKSLVTCIWFFGYLKQ